MPKRTCISEMRNVFPSHRDRNSENRRNNDARFPANFGVRDVLCKPLTANPDCCPRRSLVDIIAALLALVRRTVAERETRGTKLAFDTRNDGEQLI